MVRLLHTYFKEGVVNTLAKKVLRPVRKPCDENKIMQDLCAGFDTLVYDQWEDMHRLRDRQIN